MIAENVPAMISLKSNHVERCLKRAQEARSKAAETTDEATRLALLNEAELWERMAKFSEANPEIAKLSGN